MNKIDAHSTKCLSCGNNMEFSPGHQALLCKTCNKTSEIKAVKTILKHDVINNSLTSNNGEDWAKENKEMNCPNCGARVLLPNYQISATCPYCNTSLVASNEHLSSLKPDGVIPFAFGKEKALELFKQKINKNWLAPKALKKKLKPDEIQSYYFPAFVFDAKCKSSYEGELYEEYETTDLHGNKTTKKRYFRIDGNKDTSHYGIEVEASTRLEQKELNCIRPYNFDLSTAYSSEYISGFPFEYHNNSVNSCYNQAVEIIKNDIKNDILSNYDFDGISSFHLNTTFIDPQFSYYALPMHRINYTFKNKKYSNVINGQTGAVGGKIPKSAFKITLITLLILLGIAIPFLLVLLLH